MKDNTNLFINFKNVKHFILCNLIVNRIQIIWYQFKNLSKFKYTISKFVQKNQRIISL